MTQRRLKNGNISDTYNACHRDKFFVTEAEADTIRRSSDVAVPRRTQARTARDARILTSDVGDDDEEDWIHMR